MSDLADIITVLVPPIVTGAFGIYAGRQNKALEVARVKAEGENAREARDHEDRRADADRLRDAAASRAAVVQRLLAAREAESRTWGDADRAREFEQAIAAVVGLADPQLTAAVREFTGTAMNDTTYSDKYQRIAEMGARAPEPPTRP